MAEIRIIGNINTTTNVSRYRDVDKRLVSSSNIKNQFGLKNDYIELHVSDVGGNLLSSDFNYKGYKLPQSLGLNNDGTFQYIEIDPITNLKSYGFSSGEFLVQYNFFRNRVSDPLAELFLKEISPDRTELRVGSVTLSNDQIEIKALELINEINTTPYYKDYLLNFGNNIQVITVNILLNKTTSNYEILFKLYEPLPSDIDVKSKFWVVDEIIQPYVFQIDLDKLIIPDPLPQLRGPNFNIEVKNKNTQTTQYQSYDNVLSSYQNTASSSYYQLLSFTTSQSLNINVDYTSYSHFSKFGSVTQRLNNFFYKIQQIESNNSFIVSQSAGASLTSSLSNVIANLSASNAALIANFDGFEHYLYFESSSYTWPKKISTKPFLLYSTGSSQVQTWMTSSLISASSYDDSNLDNLIYTIPSYVREDSSNQPYILFTNMIGHYFDNIWIYLKSITDFYKAENNLNEGISKDLVYHALKSVGVKIYNSKGNEDLTNYIVGNNSGSVTDYTNLSNEFLNNVPRQDLLAETFKRIYHNVPLLFKSKGTRFGLDLLTNIFGITGSILDVKEFGGLQTKDYLKGYTTDKIRIVNNTPTGSVLSPYLSVVTQDTSSVRTIDIHRIDISFSPQNQIDTAVSSSISTLYPSFSIDDYIGDPRLRFSSSYSDLKATASLAFSSSFTKQFDYGGFIRLIKIFDNSLFKTLQDYTPARSNTTTGIVIRSPQLERNKVARPKTTPKLIASGSGSDIRLHGPIISESNNYFYNLLSGSKKAFYDGEISGSRHNIYSYFKANKNQYFLASSSVNINGRTGSFNDINLFNHSDYNVLLNNVTQSRLSSTKSKLNQAYVKFNIYQVITNDHTGSGVYEGIVTAINRNGLAQDFIFPVNTTNSLAVRSLLIVPNYITTSLIGSGSDPLLYPAEAPDSYDTLRGHVNARYRGTKVKSLLYNTYTTSSSVYEGDKSFGQTAAIDKYVLKVGLFSEVVSSSFLTQRNNVILKYLVDASGSLTELNQRNKHWQEVQNTFIAGDLTVVSLFDNQKYSNQKSSDGSKNIYNSGYSYYPMLYFTGSDSQLYFQYTGNTVAKLFRAKNERGDLHIHGVAVPGYPAYASGSVGVVYDIFETFNNASVDTFDDTNLYHPGTGSANALPYYTIPENGNYVFEGNANITVQFGVNNSNGSYTFQILKNHAVISQQTLIFSGSSTFTISDVDNWLSLSNNSWGSSHAAVVSTTTVSTDILYPDINGNNQILPSGSTVWLISGSYHFPTCDENTLSSRKDVYSIVDPTTNSYTGQIPCTFDVFGQPLTYTFYTKFDTTKYHLYNIVTGSTLLTTKNFDVQTAYGAFNQNDLIEFKLVENIFSTANYTSSLSEGKLQVQLQSQYNNINPFAIQDTSSIGQYISGTVSPDKIILNSSLSNFVDYLYLPNTGSVGPETLYSTYGDVDYTFNPTDGDLIVISYHGAKSEYRIVTSSLSGSKLVLSVTPNYPSSYLSTFGSGDINYILFLKRVIDENNIILNYIKRPGKTSYGLLIPQNIHPDVLSNIDNITTNIKNKILEVGGIASGSF